MMLTLSAIFTGYFFLYTSNFSGGSYSIRWFVTLIPLTWFFAFPFFANWTSAKNRIFLAICSVSMAIAFMGVFNQWTDAQRSLTTPPFVVNWHTSVAPRLYRLIRAKHTE
jgi:hypothetical protein